MKICLVAFWPLCTVVYWTSADVPKSRISLSPTPTWNGFSAPLCWCRMNPTVLGLTLPRHHRHFTSCLWAASYSCESIVYI